MLIRPKPSWWAVLLTVMLCAPGTYAQPTPKPKQSQPKPKQGQPTPKQGQPTPKPKQSKTADQPDPEPGGNPGTPADPDGSGQPAGTPGQPKPRPDPQPQPHPQPNPRPEPRPNPEPNKPGLTPPDDRLSKETEKLRDASDKLSRAATQMTTAASQLRTAAEKLDKEKTLVSGRIPFNGALLSFTEAEKRAKLALSFPIGSGSTVLAGYLSAPLDETTRRAPLLDRRGRPLPFQLGLSFTYNRMQQYLEDALASPGVTDLAAACMRFLTENPSKPGEPTKECPVCDPESDFQKWLQAREIRAQSDPSIAEEVRRDAVAAAHRCPSKKLSARRAEGAEFRLLPVGVAWTLGVDMEVGFDRQTVYINDLAAAPETRDAARFSAAGVFKLYPTHWLAVPMRAGLTVDHRFLTREVERCAVATSSVAEVSGRQCEDVLLLVQDSDTRPFGFLEAGVVFSIPVPGVPELSPGLEIRDRLWGLGQTAINTLSGSLFVTPTDKPVVSRFGVSLEYNVALQDEPGGAFSSGESWLIPGLLVGASL